MTRPSSGLLGAFLFAVALALAGAGLAKGGLYIGKHEGDTLHLLQIVLREARGQWPHLDFQSPIGVLAAAPIALFVWLGAGIGHAFLYAQALAAGLALPAIWWVAASRFRGGTAYLFGALVLVLILALVHGEADRSVSISMHYNRWAWAAAFVAIACAMLPGEDEFRSPVADGLVIGGALAVMALIKITYFGAFVLPVTVALIGRRAWRTIGVAAATGLMVALAVTLLAGTPFYWLAYLRDLFTVMASEVRPRPSLPLAAVVGAPSYMGGSIVLLLGVVLLRQSGRRLEGLVLLLLVPGFFYVTYQNFRNDPQWLWLLGLLLFTLRPAREHTIALGWDARQALLIAAVAAAAFSAPSALNLAYSPFRHLVTDTSTYVPLLPGSGVHTDLQTPRIRAMRLNATVALDTPGQPFAAYHDPEVRKHAATFNGEIWPDCQVELGTISWFEALSDDLKASGLTAAKTLFAADILSSFWLYGAAEPLPGAAPWYYGGLPGWAAADYLLVPLCPLSTKVRNLILDEITDSGTALTEVRRNDFYVLFAKAPASP
ncbi:MAG TPA: hypothetical protein DIU07_15075 [Rhodobacteraceae bacterium]|nr:hypothetical protein [Paracoccaceae bacterium]